MKSVLPMLLVGVLAWSACPRSGPAQSIQLKAGPIDTSQPAAATAARVAWASGSSRQLRLVQFDGPIQPEWVAQLEAAGLQIVDYIPDNAYLVYGAAAARQIVHSGAPHVKWEGAYLAGDKIHPRARPEAAPARMARTGTDDLFAVQLVLDDSANTDTVALLTALAKEPLRRNKAFRHYRNVVVRMDPGEVETIAARPDVISIAPYAMPKKLDERQGMIVAGQLSGNGPTGPGYLAWLAGKGFTQQQFADSGLVVDVCDSGLDNGNNKPNHFGLYVGGNTGMASRVVYNRLEGTPNSGSTLQGCDGHGTLNGHIIGGYNDGSAGFPHQDSAGFRYDLGIAPFVKLGSSVIFDSSDFTTPDYEDMISRAYRDGARISSDSWGADTGGDYDIDAQQYDALVRDAQQTGSAVPAAGNQGMTIVFAAGNAGSGAGTVGSPGTAKNVITVGAAENVHSHAITNRGASTTGLDGCDTPDTEANSANDIVGFSSRGPCSDGRKKPEIVAPGTHVTGGIAQEVRAMNGMGNDLACFDASGVCGLQNNAGDYVNFFPTNQQWYSTSSGTSHSTPAVAGGAALVYQYFLNQGWGAPSPAMVKAYLMNASRYMTGADANDNLWSNDQGMGMMNLGTAFDGTPRILRDQLTNDLFTATGQSRRFYGLVADSGKPVRITLGWTDAPGSTSGNAYKNNLDLVVSVGGAAYKGNVFNGAASTAGGTADAKNNAESVFLPAGPTGLVTVVVSAANVNSDGVPNDGGTLDQDFALVVANATAFTPSNYPPELDAIGNKTIATNQVLQFTVTATDSVDGDTVQLWAAGIPAWASFAGATNAGSASSAFSGTAPAATGLYAVTFYAADKDGTNSEAVVIAVNDCVATNIIDEGFAGGITAPVGWLFTGIGGTYATAGNFGRASPSLKFDGTGDQIVTPALNTPTNLQFWIKGQGTDSSSTLLIEGYNGSSWSTVASLAPLPTTASTQTLALADGLIQLRFTYTKSSGNLALDDVVIGGCGGKVPAINRAPTIAVAGGTNQTAILNEELSFVVTVNDADGDTVGVATSAAPAGASFPAASGVAPIQSTFAWTPTQTGRYSAVFVANDAQATVTQAVGIAVVQSLPMLPVPVVMAASDVQGTQFDANWLATSNAAGYRLDVATNGSFSGGSGGGVTNLGENFAGFVRTNSSADVSGALDTYMQTAGWTGAKIFEDNGRAKLGSSKAKGIITTPTVDLSANGGAALLVFDLSRYGTDAGLVQVLHAPDGSSFAQVGGDLAPPAFMAMQTIEIAGGTAASRIQIQSKALSNNRFYLDNMAITQGGGGAGGFVRGYHNRDVGDVTSETVTGLTENVTYYYRVMAYNEASNSAYSATTNVTTTAGVDVPPILNPIGPKSVDVGSLLQFQVTATPTDDDAVTLTASNLPAGATFTATNQNGTFLWTNASPTGAYSVAFYATDENGTDQETVAITVHEATMELLAPVIQAASLVQANQFNANWLGSVGATGYRLDAATNSAFRHTMGMRTATLNPGDLMVVTVDSDATEGFDAVPLVDLDAGTVIYFTDNGWTNGMWRTNEGTVVYTAPSAVAAGTVLSYRSTNANGFVKSGSFDLSASGDTILAYQGSAGSPQFLYGIGWAAATPWIESGTVTANNSMIPSGLSVAGFTIVAAGNFDNCQYDSSKGTAGAPAALLELVANSANWTGNDATAYAKFTPDFTVSTGPAINDFVPGFENLDVGSVTTHAVTGLTEGVTYYYRVKAYNATSNSAYSAVTSVVTSASIEPPDIAGFEVPAGGTAEARLTTSSVGKTYLMEYTTDLTANPVVWTGADSEAGTGGELVLQDETLSDAKRFYRIRVQ